MIKTLIYTITICGILSTSCAGYPEKRNITWTNQFYAEVLNKGNLDLIERLVSKDYVEHEVIPGFTPDRDGLVRFFKMMRTAFPDVKMHVEFMVADKDRTVSYITMTGTHLGEYMGIPATGKKINIKVIDIIKIIDDKMVDHWGVGDYTTLFEQLGVTSQ